MKVSSDFIQGVVCGCIVISAILFGAIITGFGQFNFDYGDIPTWLAGVGTIFTFVFLILQYLNMQKTQRLRDIEELRLKNVQYLEHRKKNLYSLFDELKDETEIPVEFTGRYSLYRKIYPFTDESSNEYGRPSITFAKELKQDVQHLQNCLNALDNEERTVRNISDTFNALSKIQSLLQFELSDNKLIKDLRNSNNIANLFQFTKTLDTYYQIISTINNECSLKTAPSHFIVSERATLKLERLFFKQGGVGGYDMGVPPYARRAVRILYSIYELAFDPEGLDPHIDDYGQLLSLIHLFVREDDFWFWIDNKSNLLKLINIHIDELDYQSSINSFQNEESQLKPNIQKDINNLQIQLRNERKSIQTEIERSELADINP
ncbi:hypothetical protein [Vibrio cyclitrophicus]|uniref:hypothetical protein n=1 Tax=Vibrio cyclitrophicus TaxID=47951 RepID=UPI0007EEE321|nr:hypothetical protein [Vibrio cyclitrophicus]OBT07605.1 hypothetical protein A9265_14440 [Vibrio cyclitrophicus]